MKTVAYTKAAAKSLRRMPRNVSKLIVDKIGQYAADPESQSANVIRLAGRDGYRLRVGDWRVLFSMTAETITVVDVLPRSEKTYR